MTNKPMLSVERKVIEDILADAREPGDDYMAARKVLRALLDKPACNHKACKSLGEPHPFCNFAMQLDAQHQGEPLAWVRFSAGGNPYFCSKEDHNDTFPVFRNNVAQPAPVAVVMPDNLVSHRDSWLQAMERLVDLEPRTLAPDEDDKAFWEHELSAMRDMYADFDRLNGVKP